MLEGNQETTTLKAMSRKYKEAAQQPLCLAMGLVVGEHSVSVHSVVPILHVRRRFLRGLRRRHGVESGCAGLLP